MKIHVTSADLRTAQFRVQEEILISLWQQSDQRHELTDDPKTADYILVGNIAGPNWFQSLRENPLINKFPEKCFAISDSDRPMPLLRGVYTSANRNHPFNFRYRSGAYNLYAKDLRNPNIESHQGDAFDHEKKFLCSFAGRDSSPVRCRLFRLKPREDCPIINTTSKFTVFGTALEGQEPWGLKYKSMLEESRFALCPRGVGTASMRLFEAMKMGVAPVILADDWILPKGPDWESCSIILAENEAERIFDVLSAQESRYKELGRKARSTYERYFADSAYFNYLVDLLTDLDKKQAIPEKWFWMGRNVMLAYWKLRQRIMNQA